MRMFVATTKEFYAPSPPTLCVCVCVNVREKECGKVNTF